MYACILCIYRRLWLAYDMYVCARFFLRTVPTTTVRTHLGFESLEPFAFCCIVTWKPSSRDCTGSAKMESSRYLPGMAASHAAPVAAAAPETCCARNCRRPPQQWLPPLLIVHQRGLQFMQLANIGLHHKRVGGNACGCSRTDDKAVVSSLQAPPPRAEEQATPAAWCWPCGRPGCPAQGAPPAP